MPGQRAEGAGGGGGPAAHLCPAGSGAAAAGRTVLLTQWEGWDETDRGAGVLLLLADRPGPQSCRQSWQRAAGGRRDVAGTDFQQGITALLDTVGESFTPCCAAGGGDRADFADVVLCGVGESLLSRSRRKAFDCHPGGTAAIVAVAAGDLTTLMDWGWRLWRSSASSARRCCRPWRLPRPQWDGGDRLGQAGGHRVFQRCPHRHPGPAPPLLSLYIGAAAAGAMLGGPRLDAAAGGFKGDCLGPHRPADGFHAVPLCGRHGGRSADAAAVR